MVNLKFYYYKSSLFSICCLELDYLSNCGLDLNTIKTNQRADAIVDLLFQIKTNELKLKNLEITADSARTGYSDMMDAWLFII